MSSWYDWIPSQPEFAPKGKTMKRLMIMRGLPGSGKSRLALDICHEEEEAGRSCIIQSADYHFTNDDGSYTFRPAEIGIAHFKCQKNAWDCMAGGYEGVIIDNTNISLHEFSVYLWMAREHGYEVSYHEPYTDWARDPIECAKRTTHGVPLDRVQAMAARWEELP
jgi:hypothetical protein